MILEPRVIFLMVFVVVYIVLVSVNPSLTLRMSIVAPLNFIISAIKSFIYLFLNKRNNTDKLRHYDGSAIDFIHAYGRQAYEELMSTKEIKVDLRKYKGLPSYEPPPAPKKFKHGGLVTKKVEIPRSLNTESTDSNVIQFKYEF